MNKNIHVWFDSRTKRFYNRKKAKINGIIAIQTVARKLAQTTLIMLTHQKSYEAKQMFSV
jgi:hypothetical protein